MYSRRARVAVAVVLLAGASVLVSGIGSCGSTTVPDVVGKSQAEATSSIEASSLRVGDVSQKFSPSPEGFVVDQSPDAGSEASEDSAVDLVVSHGVVVPTVTGLDWKDAQTALEGRGFDVNVRRVNLPYRWGTVFKVEPAEGQRVEAGSTVQIQASYIPAADAKDAPLVDLARAFKRRGVPYQVSTTDSTVIQDEARGLCSRWPIMNQQCLVRSFSVGLSLPTTAEIIVYAPK